MESRNIDLAKSLSWLCLLSRGIGMMPFKPSGDVSNKKFVKIRFSILYNLIFSALHLFCIFMSFYLKIMRHEEYRYDDKIVIFNIYTSLFISLVVMVCQWIFQNSLMRTFNRINELDKKLQSFGIIIDHKSVYKICIVLTLFLLLTSVWFSLTTMLSTKYYTVHVSLLFFLQYLFTMLMKTQFCAINYALKHRFLALDNKLNELIESTKDERKTGNIILVGKATEKAPNISTKVMILSEFHSKLYHACKRVNFIYSIQILLITGKYFVEITATLYYNLQKIYKPNQGMYDVMAFLLLLWSLMNAMDLFALVYISDQTCSTANNSKLTLHKLNLNHKDIELKKEVTAFSLQLLHNDLVLTAAGFFNIDFTLIFNIIGAVTTYLVIFIQFDMGEKQPSANSTASIWPANATISATYTPYTTLH